MANDNRSFSGQLVGGAADIVGPERIYGSNCRFGQIGDFDLPWALPNDGDTDHSKWPGYGSNVLLTGAGSTLNVRGLALRSRRRRSD